MSAKTTKKEADNPFAALNPKQFPAERKQRGAARQAPAGRPVASSKQAAPAEHSADPDTELFFQAVSAVRPLTQGADSRRTGLPEKKTGAAEVPDKDIALVEAPPPDIAGPSAPGAPRNDKLALELARSLEQRRKDTGQDARGENGHPAPRPEKPEPDTALLAAAVGMPDQDAEQDVFYRAVAGVAPLPGKGRAVPPEPAPLPAPPRELSNPLQDLVDGKVEFALSGTDEFMEGHVVGLDLLTVGKLQARQYSPEAHIDLHGLNSEQAFQQLVSFFRGAYHKGVRTALVVTGRGLNSPNGMPVLRFKVQQWFTQEPFRRVVLAFCTAKREDGGPGALYVLLRKYRKNSGKVRWDAVPADPDLFL